MNVKDTEPTLPTIVSESDKTSDRATHRDRDAFSSRITANNFRINRFLAVRHTHT